MYRTFYGMLLNFTACLSTYPRKPSPFEFENFKQTSLYMYFAFIQCNLKLQCFKYV